MIGRGGVGVSEGVRTSRKLFLKQLYSKVKKLNYDYVVKKMHFIYFLVRNLSAISANELGIFDFLLENCGNC
jgi:hypothetical protein